MTLARTVIRQIERHGHEVTFRFAGTPVRGADRGVTDANTVDIDAQAYFPRMTSRDSFLGYEPVAGDRMVLVAASTLGRALLRGTLIIDGGSSFRVEAADTLSANGEAVGYRGAVRGV